MCRASSRRTRKCCWMMPVGERWGGGETHLVSPPYEAPVDACHTAPANHRGRGIPLIATDASSPVRTER